ncbi:MAG: response regulator [Granulosicoccus sp.]
MDQSQNNTSSIILIVAGVVLGLTASLVALIGWKTQTLPWELSWFDGSRLDSVVQALLFEARVEVAALALVALNLIWVLLRLGRQQSETAVEASEMAKDFSARFHGDDVFIDESLVVNEGMEIDTAVTLMEKRVDCTESNDGRAGVQAQITNNELTRVRKELVVCQQQLETALKAKSYFLANMSHELRTPMNGIMGMTDLLLSGNLPEREHRFAASIASSSQSLLGIISDLLDFSRIETGSLKLEHSRFRVRDCVEDVCAMLAESAHGKGIELVCYIDDSVPQYVDGDSSRLRQILNNLISNAISFTRDGEVVVRMACIEESTTKSVFQCDVQDTGVGIEPEIQLHMFDAFTQADESSTRRHSGLGMGLAITKQLISMMDGEITFRSRLGEGTRFTFSFTMDRVTDSGNEDVSRASVRGARVLVVDDNETNRTILFHQLSNWGIEADTVASGKAALSLMREVKGTEREHDILILDLHMPEMDGIELARAIKADPELANKRALMLTSAILDLDSHELAALGIEKYISKPARQSVLHDSLVSLMSRNMRVGRIGVEEFPKPSVSINARVLLVEDNLVNQDVAMHMLEHFSCTAELAENGKQAIEMCGAKSYDIILMDCQMPETDGFEATRAIKAEGGCNASTPVIALTANAMEGDRERCIESGMDDYLSKPVSQSDLLLILEKWHHPVVAQVVDSGSAEVLNEKFDAQNHSQTPALQDADVAKVDVYVGEVAVATEEAVGVVLNQKSIGTIRDLQRPGKDCLLAKVIGVYFDRTPEMIAEMQAAVQESDVAATKAGAHSLKSSSAYLGADGLSQKCKNIELAAGENDISAIAVLVDEIAAEYNLVAVELGKLIAPKAA